MLHGARLSSFFLKVNRFSFLFLIVVVLFSIFLIFFFIIVTFSMFRFFCL